MIIFKTKEKLQSSTRFQHVELLEAKSVRHRLSRFRLIAILIIGFLSIVAQINDPVNPLYIIQSFVTLVLVWALFTKCRSAFILSISIMFILGNWSKLTFHKIFEYEYIEPIGSFTGTMSEWQNYHIYSISITIVLALSTVFFRSKFFKKNTNNTQIRYVPFVYRAAIFSTIALYSINWIFGIYRIGLGSRVELPFGLTAPISFLIFIGTPLIIALAADAHLDRSKKISTSFIISISLAFVIGSISTYSRAIFITQLLPILLGMVAKARRIGKYDNNLIKIALPFLFAMVAALALVSSLRIVTFSEGGSVDQDSIELYLNETTGLVIDRWVGAEAMMVAASTNGSLQLLTELLIEDPKSGTLNKYHELSNSRYYFIEGMTFLNLPGFFAIIALSGNLAILISATFICCILGIKFEHWVIKNFSSSETIRYTSCTALSYHLIQMAFPLLIIPFLLLIFSFIYLMKILTSMGVNYKK